MMNGGRGRIEKEIDHEVVIVYTPSMIAMSPRLLSRPVPAAWLLAVPHDEAGEADPGVCL